MFGKTPSRLIVAIALALLAPLAAASLAQAPVLNVKLATLVPENSPWTTALRTMGAAWVKATDGRVKLTVYAGTIPSESSAIARMSVDGLQAATMMVAGLGEIDPAFNIFGIPFFFESDAELACVQKKLTPMLSQKLEAKKYHLINWGNGGWVRLFSKKPIRTVAELQAANLYTTEGDPKAVQWYAQNGFHAVPLATSEIPKQFKLPTGSINAAPSPPAFALALQFFKDAPYMLDLRLGPLAAATVMTDTAWAKMSPDDRAKILAAAAETEKQVNAAAPELDQKAIDEMKKAGLQIVTLAAKDLAEFHAAADKVTSTQRGTLVPAEAFDAAVRERNACRKAAPAAAPVIVKLAALAPENAPVTNALNSMGAAWATATEGRVKLTVEAGAVPGKSPAIARMKADDLQAAMMTATGLAEIDPAFSVFGIPFFFETDAELEYVQKKLTPMLSQKLEARKFRLVNWGNVGWAHLFSKKPVRTLADLKAVRLYTKPGDPQAVKWHESNGFHAVPLDAADIPKQLGMPTGSIDAAPSPLASALALRLFKDASHMLAPSFTPLAAATVMTETAWAKIAPNDRATILAAAGDTQRQINEASPAQDSKAIAEMKKAGLTVVALDDSALKEFRAAVEKVTNTQRGTLVPADVFDAAVRERDAYRRAKK